MKILFCFGTRPEAIKMAPVIHELRNRGLHPVICITAQHREMLDSVLNFFEIITDYDLDLMTKNQDLNLLSASILKQFNSVLEKEYPEVTLVQGDTTTALMAALASFHKGIPVGHIEAGLRTYDLTAPFPEEANRQMIGRIAEFHFAPTLRSSQNLLKEGISAEKIVLTGNTIVDALDFGKSKLESIPNNLVAKEISKNLDPDKKTVLVTGHRRENFGRGLEEMCDALKRLASTKEIEIIFPVHLNPNVQNTVIKNLKNVEGIHLIEPVDYPVLLWLLSLSDLVISDSGGIQEEAPSFNIPVIVTREVSERMEGVEAGLAFLTGASSEKITKTALYLLNKDQENALMKNPYGDGQASARIIDFLLKVNEGK